MRAWAAILGVLLVPGLSWASVSQAVVSAYETKPPEPEIDPRLNQIEFQAGPRLVIGMGEAEDDDGFRRAWGQIPVPERPQNQMPVIWP